MTIKSHHHITAQTSSATPYFGPVGPHDQQDRRAHGGCMYTDVCGCGAIRRRNVNGIHEEVGHWHHAASDIKSAR